jgi:hypothetical protein
MDSLMSLEIRNRLEASLGLRLSAAILFTHPTTSALVEHLLVELHLDTTPLEDTLDRVIVGYAEPEDTDLTEAAAAAMLDEKLLEVEDYLK